MPAPLPLNDGDNSFVGVNSRLDPGQLSPGFVAEAINMRFDKGVAAPRKGLKKIGFANLKNTSNNPSSLNNNKLILNVDQGLTYYDKVRGIGKFQDPAGFSWLLIAIQTKVYALRHGNPQKVYPIANDNDVQFVQCFNKVFMFRGLDVAPLVLSDVDVGWEAVTQEDTDLDVDENNNDGTEPIPESNGGAIFMSNRLFVINSATRDLIAASDSGNASRYQPILQSFRINQGSEDALVALHKYDETTLLCFKENSVYAIRNVYGNLSDTYLDEITADYGLVSRRAVCTVGKDVWFLSDQRGVVSLSVSESGKMQGVDAPVSEPIDGIISRIHWPYANQACSTYFDSKYWLAIPIDNSKVCNAIVCYDFKLKSWTGMDQSDEIDGIKEFIQYKFQGKKRLFFITNNADKGFVNLYNDETYCGNIDESVDVSDGTGRNITTKEIETSLTTRGYKCSQDARKRFKASAISFDSNGVVSSDNSKGITATALFDGINEEATIFSNKNFSRTKYSRPFDKSDYVLTNANNDYATAYREDYSVALAGSEGIDPGAAGFDPDLLQESTQKNFFNGDGTYVQLKIVNNVGSCTIKNIAVGAVQHDRHLIEKR